MKRMDDFLRPKRPKLRLTEDGHVETRPSAYNPKNDGEPAFKPPEDVAAGDSTLVESRLKVKKLKKNWLHKRWNVRMPKGRKQWAIAGSAVVLFLSAAAAAWWFLVRPSTRLIDKSKPLEKVAFVPKPTTVASKLSGLQVEPAVNERPVTAIMIENSPDARPQSGLKDASVVYEAVAEGGITRFNALFQDTQPDYIGPVRSVRPYYIDWFLPFDASLAHVGGSPQGLADVRSLGVKDLDQFVNSGYYTRITERYAPHNVYTSIAKLNELEQAKGFTTANFTGFDRKKEAASKTPTAAKIDLSISSALFNVHYDYDAGNNSYLRSEGGEPHKDLRSGAQISPKVVIAVVMQRGIDGDGQHTDYTTTGSGKVYVFQDGIVTEGTWGKTSRQAQWTFTGSDNKPMQFNPGQTWITMVDTSGSVTSSL